MYLKAMVCVFIFIFILPLSISARDQYVEIEIKGMTCPLCPLAIKKSILDVKGVKDVNVSLREEKAWLRVDEAVSNETLLEAIKRAGPYTGRVIDRKNINEK